MKVFSLQHNRSITTIPSPSPLWSLPSTWFNTATCNGWIDSSVRTVTWTWPWMLSEYKTSLHIQFKAVIVLCSLKKYIVILLFFWIKCSGILVNLVLFWRNSLKRDRWIKSIICQVICQISKDLASWLDWSPFATPEGYTNKRLRLKLYHPKGTFL